MSELRRRFGLICVMFLAVMLLGCVAPDTTCPSYVPVDMSGVQAFATDASLPFQFPLDDEDLCNPATPFMTVFAKPAIVTDISDLKYHAAEDYAAPPGTPVYAIADGKVSFSGRMGGYGWLVIVDHPQANLYSLYGHLSPSRWSVNRGPVNRGELLGYLGDSDENGGSAKYPLVPHLHFGIRTGQRGDFPAKSEWRWQAGWIKFCPQDLGWVQPSVMILGQNIPDGGFTAKSGGFFVMWGMELVFTCVYLIGGASAFIYATRKDKPVALIVSGCIMLVAGVIFYMEGWKMSVVLLLMGVGLPALGIYRLLHRSHTIQETGIPKS